MTHTPTETAWSLGIPLRHDLSRYKRHEGAKGRAVTYSVILNKMFLIRCSSQASVSGRIVIGGEPLP
jgi:hypothetical protein